MKSLWVFPLFKKLSTKLSKTTDIFTRDVIDVVKGFFNGSGEMLDNSFIFEHKDSMIIYNEK